MNKYIGKRIEGRYVITDLIGDGGMANVYKATDILEDRTVAVKILKDEFLENEEFIRRFKNESKAIALLNHQNIVRVYDVSFSEKMMSIVMEYVEGVTLKDYIELRGALSYKDAVYFMTQILRALQHAHDNGIVHRDVKPQNIMIMEDGSVKVMDFGIARFSRSGNKTITHKAIGSVHYISPEQACGEKTDEKSDIYSCGVMLYEMLTGSLPFEADSAVSVAIMQMQNEPKRPTEIKEDIPEGLEEIVLRAMQKDPMRRYQSSAEMLRDIDEFKKNPSISFEYKYFGSTDQTTKYFDAVKKVGDPSAEEKAKNKKFLSALFGVAAGFILLALVVVLIAVSGIMSPKGNVAIGDLTGLKLDEVKADAHYKSITFIETEEFSTEFEAGEIISHTKANRTVKEGSAIEVVVSKGSKKVVIPDVYGMTAAEAEKKLIKEGFTIKTISKFDIEIAENSIVNTKPERNTEAVYGSEIILYVSLGAPKEYTSVPDLAGMTKEAAEKAIADYGLRVVFETVDSDLPKDKVVSQSMKADEQVETDTIIIVQISSGVAPNSTVKITVPIPKYLPEVTLRFFLEGELVHEKTLSKDYSPKTYEYDLVGSGKGNLIVKLGSASNAFKTYKVDFNKGSYTDETVTDVSGLTKITIEMPVEFKNQEVWISFFNGIEQKEQKMQVSAVNKIDIFGGEGYTGTSEVTYKLGSTGKYEHYGTMTINFKTGTASVSADVPNL